jgi:hypothetical protein
MPTMPSDVPQLRQRIVEAVAASNPVMCGRNLITGLTSAVSPKVDISSTCNVGQKLGVSLPLLTPPPPLLPSRLQEGLMNYPVYFQTKFVCNIP